MIKEHFTIYGADDRPFTGDLRYNPDIIEQPLILFLHGFKGFKDWGHFNLMADELVNNGFAVFKINFSHNGTTPDHPTDFHDLEAFGRNTLGKELNDIKAAVDFVWSEPKFGRFNLNRFYVMGHSRGGGTAIVFTAADRRVKRLVTLASIASVENRFTPEQIQEWEEKGVIYIYNGRTGQNMPMYREMLDEYRQNKENLDPLHNARHLECPHLIIHGTADETVNVSEARQLESATKNARLFLIDGAGHTFGGKHPFNEAGLPEHTLTAVKETVKFLSD